MPSGALGGALGRASTLGALPQPPLHVAPLEAPQGRQAPSPDPLDDGGRGNAKSLRYGSLRTES